MLLLTAFAWVFVSLCVVVLDDSSAPQVASELDTDTANADCRVARESKDVPGATFSSLLSLANGAVGFVAIFAFFSCLSPKLDFYMFRQHVLGLSASQQALISMAGSFGWWLGASAYKHRITV